MSDEARSTNVNEQLRKYLKSAPELYPDELDARFPRILKRIVEAWDFPVDAAALFAELLVDDRGDRQGFPPEVAREIFLLSVAYDRIRALPVEPDDVWAHERDEATASLEELGLRLTPADMLRSAENRDPGQLLLFLRAGMPVDSRDSREWTPLMVAAFHGNEANAKLLIEHGADPRARDRAGYTPLHWAALRGYEEVVQLIASRVEVNVQSNAGLTPLLQAAAAGHLPAVRRLLETGADANIASNEGWTPLHKAVANRHVEVVRVLVGAGASVTARHDNGSTPVSLAKAAKQRDILNALRSPAPAG